jgi:dihydroorotate dehydrogenase (fumarate)
MVNLETDYLGIILRNPIIISSSGLTNTVEKIKNLERCGAGAVILKSIFEEDIRNQAMIQSIANDPKANAPSDIHPVETQKPIEDYLLLIEKTKKAVKIPVLASINCYSAEEWTGFATKIEAAGADAIEINVFYIPTDKDFTSLDYERIYFDLAIRMRTNIGIPFSIKLSPYFTNISYLADQLFYRGASGVVLFNRFYEPDIDIEHVRHKAAEVLSLPADLRPTLQWVAFVSSQVEDLDVAASTGVHSGEAIIKLLLAGAKAVQVCSVIYKNGPEYLSVLLNELTSWMQNNNFENIEDFRGKINYKDIPDLAMYERAQFMKYFTDIQ